MKDITERFEKLGVVPVVVLGRCKRCSTVSNRIS